IVLNGSGSIDPALRTFTLTFKGGWTGVGGSISSTTPSTINNAGFSIAWNNSVTMSNIVVTGAPSGQDGIYISTPKNITLTNVQSNNGREHGAYLDTTGGTGTVTITNGTFNNNDLGNAWSVGGLLVSSNGAITLTGVTVDNNFNSTGASLDNNSPSGAPVSINSSVFNDNSGSSYQGLHVDSAGVITLNTVTAEGNAGAGAALDNCNYSGSACTTNGKAVTLIGTNIFDSNAGFVHVNGNYAGGLSVYSGGAITSSSLEANSNTYIGAVLDNSSASAASSVTLNGTSSVSGNGNYSGDIYSDGLRVFSRGAITVNNLSAVNDGGTGTWLYNMYTSPFAVKVTGTNLFEDNGLGGIQVNSDGAITLNNITANLNGLSAHYDGLVASNIGASNAQAITLTGTNTFNNNTLNGAELSSTGAITANNVTAELNTDAGMIIENDFLASPALHPQSVSLLGTNNLSFNGKDNLDVSSYGAVSISNLTANSSTSGTGADLYHDGANGYDPTSKVTLTGTNSFSFNGPDGLLVYSNGAVSLSNVTALYNSTGAGVFIENDHLGSSMPQSVMLLGTNTFNNNATDGLDVQSYGAITLDNVTANTNVGGVDLFYNAIPTGNVTLNGTNTFDSNSSTGLVVQSNGTVTANNLNADDDGTSSLDAGVSINNVPSSGSAAPSVTLTGVNTFDFNIGIGLTITSKGAIAVSNLNAVAIYSKSKNDGVDLINTAGTAGVTITGNNTFDDYYGYGLHVTSNGAITASNLTADGDGTSSLDAGVSINNVPSSGSAAPSVTLTGVNTFDFNTGIGLTITSKGAITASNLNAVNIHMSSNNDGVDLINTAGTAGVTITGTNTFDDYYGYGLHVTSNGAITASNLTADGDGNNTTDYGGAVLDNSSGTGNLTLSGNNTFSGNYGDGLNIFSHGTIVTNNLTADSNGMGWLATGVAISDEPGVPHYENVTLKGVNTFNGNAWFGLDVDTLGSITASNVTANSNGTDGAQLVDANVAKGNITLTGTNVFLNNGGMGVLLASTGSVSLTNLTADSNYYDGMNVQTASKVVVTCGSFIGNGLPSHDGYGWETGTSGPPYPASVTMIATDSVGNYTAPYTTNGGGTPLFESTCPNP
ncbi:MAG TPA: hypothetical protein VLX61_08945, partial [Anaerolineales bacterium]|nr:hypothetical protein [Anaerolineales bacterium]